MTIEEFELWSATAFAVLYLNDVFFDFPFYKKARREIRHKANRSLFASKRIFSEFRKRERMFFDKVFIGR